MNRPTENRNERYITIDHDGGLCVDPGILNTPGHQAQIKAAQEAVARYREAKRRREAQSHEPTGG